MAAPKKSGPPTLHHKADSICIKLSYNLTPIQYGINTTRSPVGRDHGCSSSQIVLKTIKRPFENRGARFDPFHHSQPFELIFSSSPYSFRLFVYASGVRRSKRSTGPFRSPKKGGLWLRPDPQTSPNPLSPAKLHRAVGGDIMMMRSGALVLAALLASAGAGLHAQEMV